MEKETHADILNQLVNARTGETPGAQWFFRKDDGYGLGIDAVNIDESYIGREMSPRMFVEQQWENDSERALFEDFINWLSPWLLLMDFLSDSKRQSFENAARQHALLADEMHWLYPEVINKKNINAARVEAVLRKATSAVDETEEIQSFCYIDS